nr:unnamed protein product [Callosobruchus chinensis]
MAEGGGGHSSAAGGRDSPPSSQPRESPPKAVIDTTPIHMDQNKESLKVKLLLRRPFDQLVAQGIMPPHKTPAAYHGQRRQLERAKTGDMLKAKIQQRPPRQELERRHILEADPNHVDPSLAERQRMLKKARLADQLNDQLSHRPGPLELIQKNILHTEEPIEQAVKTGRIPYKATSEGQLNRPQLPSNYINPEEDSQSSEGDNTVSPSPSDVLETAAKSAGIMVSLIQPTEGSTVVVTSATPILSKDTSEIVFADLCRSVTAPLISQQQQQSPAASLVSSTSTLSPLSSVSSPVPSVVSQPATPIPPPPPPPIALVSRAAPSPKTDAPGKDKNRKKSKSKSAPKARTIKFHEYKGPPSAQKNAAATPSSGESSYDLLLKQQTLLLQFQLQLQHKYPQIILPASQKTSSTESTNVNNVGNSSSNNFNTQQPSPSSSTFSDTSTSFTRISGRLEDMKVSDLKAELKRRNLPVSGSKPQLIERLKPFTNSPNDIINQSPSSVESSVHSSNMDQSHNSPSYQDIDSPESSVKDELCEQMDVDPSSPAPNKMQQEPFMVQQSQQNDVKDTLVQQKQKTNEDIVREQQRQIEELQRELTLSQLKLQAATRSEPKAQMIALQKHLQGRQQQQQQANLMQQMKQLQALQEKQAQINEEQQRLQQQQHVAFQNQKNISGGLLLNGTDAALVFNQLMQGKAKVVNGHARHNSLPNLISSLVTPILTAESKANYIDSNGAIPEIKIEYNNESKPPPPQYDEATKHLNNNKKNHIKSEIVDDVLEILIKNGELPPSAANDPLTPGSAGIKSTEPIFTTNCQINNNDAQTNGNIDIQNPEDALGIDPSDLLETLDNIENMDFSQLVMELGGCQGSQNENNNLPNHPVPENMESMDTDDWLASLLPSSDSMCNNSAPLASHETDLGGYDPLLSIAQDPFDPFNLEEFRGAADLSVPLSWDRVDYTA